MGLKISTFKKRGQIFTNAYAKVGNVQYDNNSKTATYCIKIFVSKEDKNLIAEIQNQRVKIIAGTDMIAQCYTKIDTHISQLKAQIAKLETETAAIVDNDNLKFRNENQIALLKESEILQLENSVEW